MINGSDLMLLHKMAKDYKELYKRNRGFVDISSERVLLTAREFFELFSDIEYEYTMHGGYRYVETVIDEVVYAAQLAYGIVQEVAV